MTDFETTIRDMVKNGSSTESIAELTTNILNTIQKERDDTESRKETLSKFQKMIERPCKEKEFSVPEAAIICTLACAKSYPEWNKQELEEFRNSMRQAMTVAASMVGKNPAQIFENTFKGFSDKVKNNKENKKTPDPTANPRYKYPEESLRHLLDLIWG